MLSVPVLPISIQYQFGTSPTADAVDYSIANIVPIPIEYQLRVNASVSV